MTWTYDVAGLSSNSKDQMRLLVGDTLSDDPQLQDEEIQFLLTTRSSIYGAAAQCCRSIASQYSRKADAVQGELHTLYSAQAKAYSARAAEYENRSVAAGGALPYAGGISIADKQAQEQNADRVPPQFALGMEDNYLPIGPAGNETLQPPEETDP